MNDHRRVLERFRFRLHWRSRWNRALTVLLISVGAVSAAHVVLTAMGLVGWFASRAWTAGWTLSVAVLITLVSGASLLIPLRGARILRRADRRLGLQGALVTALEVTDSREPICRLLVQRTALAVDRLPSGRAVPLRPHRASLLVPALIVLACGLEAAARLDSDEVSAVVVDPAARIFSHDLQAAVSALFGDAASDAGKTTDPLRTLLDIDAALLKGEIGLDQARAELAEWLDSEGADARRSNRAGSPESDPASSSDSAAGALQPSEDPISALQALADPIRAGVRSTVTDARATSLAKETASAGPGIPRTDSGGLTGGRGSGAGIGVAASGPHGTTVGVERDRIRAGAVWSLPDPDRTTASAAPGEAPSTEEHLSVGGGGEQAGSRLTAIGVSLTEQEREVVDAYFLALKHKYESNWTTGGAGAEPGDDQEKEPLQ